MGVLLVGVAVVALAVFDLSRNRVPKDAVRVRGTVVDVEERRSKLAGRRSARVFAPVVSYEHPRTHRREQLRSEAFTEQRHEVGDTIEVAYSPSRDRMTMVTPRRWVRFAALVAVAVVLIGLQVNAWLG